MKRISFPLLVASSLFLATIAFSETRPHYGGTLHVAIRDAPLSLDPSEIARAHGQTSANLASLLFDTLTRVDERGQLQPGLARSWQADSGNRRWRFVLRTGVTFSDGKPLTADSVVASLKAINAGWKIFSEAGAVIVEGESPAPYLPAQLALPRNGIAKRDGGKELGTGPFVVSQWLPSKHLTAAAREDYWGGRPFLDSIEIEMGESLRDQMIALDLGKAQLIEIAPEKARSAGIEDREVSKSAGTEMMALVFSRPCESAQEQYLRDAFSLSIDRESLNKVVLQGEGDPTGGLLPDWMTGYEFIFPAQMNLTRAREERSQVQHAPVWTLKFDPNDPVENIVAQRIVLNANEAGLRLQLSTGSASDLRLVRLPLASLDVHVALDELATALGLPQPQYATDSLEDVYSAEKALLDSHRVIPLLRSPREWGVAGTVRNLAMSRDGTWQLPNAWISPGKP
ncbi:MAG TPA: ABC transporter substrate-binding protein [Terriglobales bacterium]|jgi:peptide/nickel transport system substrate-binding protein|nr:ABC transporter substrate-binding protein [Terriglobales bacterium]